METAVLFKNQTYIAPSVASPHDEEGRLFAEGVDPEVLQRELWLPLATLRYRNIISDQGY